MTTESKVDKVELTEMLPSHHRNYYFAAVYLQDIQQSFVCAVTYAALFSATILQSGFLFMFDDFYYFFR